VASLYGLNILVTGGTGSFGQAFTDYALSEGARVTVYSRDEFKQSQMAVDFNNPSLCFVVGDIRDVARLTDAMKGIDVVVHAAAMKQVPACEENPTEAIDSNVTGSRNVIMAAVAAGVGKVVALSTDKATHPTNTYGATKMLSERLFLAGSQGHTRCCVVRCGNIFGSRGSVVPLFQAQAKTDGIITITDARMTRYSITPDEAVRIVETATLTTHGGEIFVPKMASYNLLQLVQALAPACLVKNIGLRAGERLHECLITEIEALDARDEGSYWVIEWGHGDGTVYATSSDKNDDWLTIEDIREMAS
jgi:UDP-N-acetylglucosamine 4,6-dehydratase